MQTQKMRRRKLQGWNLEESVICPVCRYIFPPLRVIDSNQRLPVVALDEMPAGILDEGKWNVGIGHQNASCPACGTFLVLQVEMTGSYFDKTGMGIAPIVRLLRAKVNENDPERELGEGDLEVVQVWWLEERETWVEERSQTSEVRSKQGKE